MTLNAAEISGMRGEVQRTQLDMTCTIQRRTPGAEDPHGSTEPGTWANLLVSTPCHYWEIADDEIVGPSIQALVTKERIVLAANVDVTPADRVLQVIGVDGVPIAGVMTIEEVLVRLQETILAVRSVR